jgi:hypothetical protein
MSFFDKIFKNIFTNTDNPAIGVAVHEVLRRSSRDLKAYEAWKLNQSYSALLQEVNQAYYYKKTGIRSDITIHLFQSDYANGFAISYLSSIGKKNFQHLFDFFKERVAAMSYRTANADRQIIDKKSYVETREKYYLKPPLSLQDTGDISIPSDQLYVNISIEHVLADNHPQYIKVLVSIYADRWYKHAQSYDEFADRLLATKENQ